MIFSSWSNKCKFLFNYFHQLLTLCVSGVSIQLPKRFVYSRFLLRVFTVYRSRCFLKYLAGDKTKQNAFVELSQLYFYSQRRGCSPPVQFMSSDMIHSGRREYLACITEFQACSVKTHTSLISLIFFVKLFVVVINILFFFLYLARWYRTTTLQGWRLRGLLGSWGVNQRAARGVWGLPDKVSTCWRKRLIQRILKLCDDKMRVKCSFTFENVVE